jgi:hypothetical protein
MRAQTSSTLRISSLAKDGKNKFARYVNSRGNSARPRRINPTEVTVRKIRCAVVGLGHISQAAFLPGFKNAKNSVLAALVSDDSKKLKEVAKRCRVHASSPSGR